MPSEQANLTAIGWREWAKLPELGLSAIKFKTDTGARTSAIHATDISYFSRDQQHWARFRTWPIQGNNDFSILCESPLVDTRIITNSGGQQETRPVIQTTLVLGRNSWQIKLSLTNREKMKFRMLLGRRAMTKHCLVDPSKSYLNGRLDPYKSYAIKPI